MKVGTSSSNKSNVTSGIPQGSIYGPTTDCNYFVSIGEVDYKINNSQLVKDLGVTFDPKLNLNHHIYVLTHKATKILGTLVEHIGRLARMSVLDTEVDGLNPGSSMLFP